MDKHTVSFGKDHWDTIFNIAGVTRQEFIDAPNVRIDTRGLISGVVRQTAKEINNHIIFVLEHNHASTVFVYRDYSEFSDHQSKYIEYDKDMTPDPETGQRKALKNERKQTGMAVQTTLQAQQAQKYRKIQDSWQQGQISGTRFDRQEIARVNTWRKLWENHTDYQISKVSGIFHITHKNASNRILTGELTTNGKRQVFDFRSNDKNVLMRNLSNYLAARNEHFNSNAYRQAAHVYKLTEGKKLS